MKIVDKFALTLFCLTFALVIPMLRVQAAEDIADVNLIEREVCWTVTLENSYDSKVYTFGGNPYVVSGEGLRIYSFGFIDDVSGNIRFDIFAFSPGSIKKDGDIILSNLKSVNIDGSIVNYVSLDNFSTRLKTENDRYGWINPVWSGFPNLTMYSETKDFNFIAKGIAEDMARAGYYDYDDSGWVTDKLEPDTSGAKSADFSLADVKFWKDDSYFYASWSGLTEYFENEDISNDFISVSAGFYNSGISVSKSIGYFYLKDNSLKIPLSKLANYENDELSMIKLVPYHYAGSGHSELYKGKSSTTYFNDLFYDDEWGTYYDSECFIVNPKMSYTKGTSALSGTLSTFMGKELSNGMYSYSSRNMNYTFLWESVNTSIEADLSLSHMRIDIVCDNREYVFSNSGHLLSSGSIEISLQEILSLLQDNDVKPVIESFSIKYTPYYTIGRKTYHGQSVRFIVQANSAGILQISQGDDSFNEDSDYSDVDIVPPDDLPIEIPGFTDDESFEFDFIYDSDNMFKNFFNSLKSLISYCGQIPFLVNKVFSFLPSIYGNMIVVILAACFVMRLLGR